MPLPLPLWSPKPDRAATTALSALMTRTGHADYDALYAWSVTDPAAFWNTIWDFCEVIGDKGQPPFLAAPHDMLSAQFFPHARLNYAENLLRPRDPAETALVFRAEDKIEQRLSFGALLDAVSQCQQALRAAGVVAGDRVAGLMPNCPETIIAMLATTALGAIWSSASPDFGAAGILDRFGQIQPKVLITVDGYYYGGQWRGILDKIAAVLPQMPSVVQTLVVKFDPARPPEPWPANVTHWHQALSHYQPQPIMYEHVAFNHPLFILYSSGTTGVPKCIVHGHGGTLLQHLKEHRLHSDIRPHDRFFYYTTCGWMMWNWLASGLASQATLVLFDGSPFAPTPSVLWDYAEAEKVTFFGTSAKYIDALKKEGLRPRDSHDLGALRSIGSTGSPLVAESFDFVYDAIKPDVHLASISGGTDIVSCFVLGNPLRPVWRGELQGAGLGLAVDIWRDDGTRADSGEKGELVCTRPFPAMPVMFWNDADGAKYRKAYFSTFPNVWHHGDFAERTANGGFIIHGRSDTTLNPGGVRIGTAEIYRQVEQIAEIRESVVIGQKIADDEQIVLFVVLQTDAVLDTALEKKIRDQIRKNTSPRHVPAKIIAVRDIPKTKSGKISEVAVRDTVHGIEIKNKEALANPECLEGFRTG